MEFLKENAPVILTMLLLVILVLVVVGILLNTKLVKNLVTKRFSFHDIKEVDKDTNVQSFSIIVANRSLSDVAVNSIGVVSGLKFFDFRENFRDGDRFSEKPVIPQRASIKLTIGITELEELIFSNAENGKLKKTCVYVIDSSGNMSKCRARNFHKILKADYEALLRRQKLEAKREDFESVREEIRASEASGKPVTLWERVKLVFAKFPRGEAPAAPAPETERTETPETPEPEGETPCVETAPEAPEELPETGEDGEDGDDPTK